MFQAITSEVKIKIYIIKRIKIIIEPHLFHRKQLGINEQHGLFLFNISKRRGEKMNSMDIEEDIFIDWSLIGSLIGQFEQCFRDVMAKVCL